MFNSILLSDQVQDYIIQSEGDISKLAFAGSPFPNVSTQELVQQIDSRRRIEKKLPTWYKTKDIIYPPKLNLEQTSSEITAAYKTDLVSGKSLADISGGFGVDSYYFSKKFDFVDHFEKNLELSLIANHNFKVLGANNISCYAEDGVIASLKNRYDVIYADPSRRHDKKGKVFLLNDCEPNIPAILDQLNFKMFLLKTSPMLDISVGQKELSNIAEIHIVAVDNDVKELLWVLKKNVEVTPTIYTVNFSKEGIQKFSFSNKPLEQVEYSLPEKFLYEPNAAILKSGGQDALATKNYLSKLNANTHLYTTDKLIDYPGRKFLIEKNVLYTKKNIKEALQFKNANVTTRNFPESVATIRKKWKLGDGGNVYLFFITDMENNKRMLVCSKM